MKRFFVLLYGVIAYFIFFGTLLYAIGFVGNFFVPKSIDSEPVSSLPMALLINAALLGLFAVQHSAMARPAFKKWWTRTIHPAAERSTYVLLSSLCLIALMAFWQPVGGVIWSVESPTATAILTGISLLGYGIVVLSTFLINHFDLFGLRQVWFYFRKQAYVPLKFRTPLFYKYVRHPLYLGWMIAFWFTPVMTIAHLFFAAMTTLYMLKAIQFEEKDLISEFGEKYVNYKKSAAMLIPSFRKNKEAA